MKPNLLGMFYKALQPEDEGGFTLRLLPLATLVENANFVEDNNLMAAAHDITQTIYDLKVVETGVQQRYLRNRVSAVYRYEDNAAMIANSGNATIYSYDELGNVNVLVQKLVVNNEVYVKQVRYEYDLQSGKVNKVTFQKGAIDQYSHRYEYDADNRITDVYTSRDGRFESRDAKYFYYPHGPLARVELGDGKVQGVDYVYTLQGWLKGTNYLDPTASQDGVLGIDNYTPQDEVSYMLGYYENDYQSIASSSVDAFAVPQLTPYYNNTSHQVNGHKGLFNGNIALMATMIRHFGETDFNEAYNINEYQYDQLNRIKNCDGRRFTMYPYITNTVSMSYNYDPNGNITHLTRNGIDASGTTLDMDELTYGYSLSGGKLVNNRLSHVDDAIIGTNSNNFDNDIEDQSTGNYEYDEIGNLIGDQAEEIDEIVWDVYGKIKSINFDTKSDLDFQYDPMGNRIAKIVKNTTTQAIEKTTLYFRDAQGNVLMTEEILAAVTNNIKGSREFAIYGSSRLGVYTEDVLDVLPPAAPNEYERIVGLRAYELSNHLGNVLATISDYKSIVVETAIDPITQQIIITDFYYEAVVLTASDYDPFGMQLEYRTYTDNQAYRYGFNGKENDNEVYGENNAYDFGARICDVRLGGRFFSIDPLSAKFPAICNYTFGGNSPIKNIDVNGLWSGDVNVLILLEGEYQESEQTVIKNGDWLVVTANSMEVAQKLMNTYGIADNSIDNLQIVTHGRGGDAVVGSMRIGTGINHLTKSELRAYQEGNCTRNGNDIKAFEQICDKLDRNSDVIISGCGVGNDPEMNEELFKFIEKSADKKGIDLFLSGDNVTYNKKKGSEHKWVATFDKKLIKDENYSEGFLKLSKKDGKIESKPIGNIKVSKENPRDKDIFDQIKEKSNTKNNEKNFSK